MGPFFQFILAESWGCPGMLRMPSGFKTWRLFAHGLQTLSRLLNARALSGSNPQPPFLIIKKGPKWDPSSNSYWRRAGDSNPRCPFGAYSLSRRAPSASRSALRNSRSIVTKQPKLSKGEFSNCLAAFPPCSLRPYPSERLREPSSSLPMVRHIWKMQPRARKKKPLSTSCTATSAS